MINIRIMMNDEQAVSNKIQETVDAINAEIREDSSSETPDKLSIDKRQGFVDIVLGGEIIETIVIDEVEAISVLLKDGKWANPIAIASSDGEKMQQYTSLDLLLQHISRRIQSSYEDVHDLLVATEQAARPYFRLKD